MSRLKTLTISKEKNIDIVSDDGNRVKFLRDGNGVIIKSYRKGRASSEIRVDESEIPVLVDAFSQWRR